MATDQDRDARLELAYQLLRVVLQQPEPETGQPGQLAPPPFLPPTFQDQLSATDLLGWWFRPAAGTVDPWDDYFARTPQALTSPLGRSAADRPPPPLPPPGISLSLPPVEDGAPWTDPRTLIADPMEELADEHAEAAVACLYDFVHAIGRRDVDAAMGYVADDYHVLEDDHEIDRLGLRHQIEALLDSLRGWEVMISLAQMPEPLPHPCGILIYCEMQVDAFQQDQDLRRSTVDRRIAVCELQSTRQWAISALSRVSA